MNVFSQIAAFTVAAALGSVSAAPPASPSTPDPVARELLQLQNQIDRFKANEELKNLQIKNENLDRGAFDDEKPAAPAGVKFKLKEIETDQSEVLSKDEIDSALDPWVGRTIDSSELSDLLQALNDLYTKKGYAVCRATLKPQRISNGRLYVTLIEGRTESVEVSGLENTNPRYILRAMPLEEGRVDNYRDLQASLVRFNMTNDVELAIDIKPGSEYAATKYEIKAREPDLWRFNFAADTTGGKSTGRPKASLAATNTSLFGWRDQATILGLASEGSKSLMLSYSLPISSFGTRLIGTTSFGDVKIVGGPSAALDVTGSSELYSIRLEHPALVSESYKATVYGSVSHQKSKTDMFGDLTINDTQNTALSIGVDAYWIGSSQVAMASAAVSTVKAKENLSGFEASYRKLFGTATWRWQPVQRWTFSAAGAFQAALGGDDFFSTDYFYLGHTSGVRGYDNDVASAEDGFWVNLQASRSILNQYGQAFAFIDAGRISSSGAYESKTLWSAGFGATVPLFSGASLTASAAFPLEKDLGDSAEEVSKARFDISVSASW